jgi:hypothetical protein
MTIKLMPTEPLRRELQLGAPTNAQRADWALQTLDTFCLLTVGDTFKKLDPQDQRAAVGDLIGDLGHLCVRAGLDYRQVLEEGKSSFIYDVAQEAAQEEEAGQ